MPHITASSHLEVSDLLTELCKIGVGKQRDMPNQFVAHVWLGGVERVAVVPNVPFENGVSIFHREMPF